VVLPGPAAVALPPAAPPPERLVSRTRRVGANGTPGQVLTALGLAAGESQAVLAALAPHLPFRRVRPGDQVRLERAEADGALRSLTWRQGPADEVIVRPCGEGLCGERRDVSLHSETVRVAVTIRSSPYEALREAGEDPALAVAASDVLAWDVDFYQDVRPGDSLRVVVEKVHADGRFLRYGEVLAVEYDGRSAGRKRFFRYTDPEGGTAYFDDAGQSARRGFLRAPVPWVHLTSRFGGRRHPVLGYVRAHQGVDYAAPAGTPVWSVGDGVVTQAGWSGGCGMTVAVRHRNGLESMYCHLSRIDVAAGSRVAQKQVVGAVGKTGLATGPHLHFAVRQGGAFVNPMRLQLPHGLPVRAEWLADFLAKIGPLRERLDRAPVAWAG
jgi:murein DD-endopeptidase MepM/ murein hydrolase activator NlpD